MKNWNRMNLQLFADNGDGDPEGESNGGGTGSEDSKGMSFDDFLKEGVIRLSSTEECRRRFRPH